MTISAYAKLVHPILEANGFKKKKGVWNRHIGEYVDVVDLQLSKSKDMVALNIGVFDKKIYSELWPDNIPDFIDIESCIVNTRIGGSDINVDKWWDLDDETGPT